MGGAGGRLRPAGQAGASLPKVHKSDTNKESATVAALSSSF